MKKLLLITVILALPGCAGQPVQATGNFFLDTSPGGEMPVLGALCQELDMVGRCKKVSTGTGMCVNPKGHDVEPFLVPCSSIKK